MNSQSRNACTLCNLTPNKSGPNLGFYKLKVMLKQQVNLTIWTWIFAASNSFPYCPYSTQTTNPSNHEESINVRIRGEFLSFKRSSHFEKGSNWRKYLLDPVGSLCCA